MSAQNYDSEMALVVQGGDDTYRVGATFVAEQWKDMLYDKLFTQEARVLVAERRGVVRGRTIWFEDGGNCESVSLHKRPRSPFPRTLVVWHEHA